MNFDKLNKSDEHGIVMTDKHVFFYSNECPFSNFYQPCNFLYAAFGECHRFFTSEQAFMWHKALLFDDKEMVNAILQANTNPKECKNCGRLVKNYDESVWNKVRYQVFVDVNFAKFSQNEDLKNFILQDKFKGKHFVEASPHDGIWGVKMPISDPKIVDENNWKGQNLLGKCLDEVRNKLLTIKH